jgi:hypothetical protein
LKILPVTRLEDPKAAIFTLKMFRGNRLHCKKKVIDFSVPAGMSLTKLSLAGNN